MKEKHASVEKTTFPATGNNCLQQILFLYGNSIYNSQYLE